MSGLNYRCRGCKAYLPRKQFYNPGIDAMCRCCDPGVSHKTCTTCEKCKPIGEFHVDRKARDGRRKECAACRNDYYRRWRVGEHKEVRRRQAGFNSDHITRLIARLWA